MNKNMWMVRAGSGSWLFETFKEKGLVAIGLEVVGDLSGSKTRDAVTKEVVKAYPDWSKGKQSIWAGQLFRFVNEIQQGDAVLTYDTSRRVYLVGRIASDYRHDPIIDPDYACLRNVEWLGEVDRDKLSVATKNSLGAISTLFLVPNEFAREIEATQEGKLPGTAAEEEETTEEELIFADIEDRALQFIQDRVNRLDWQQMQDLVAGLLRAMGYKTRVSTPGADRGKDIVASPDGFGFENPRIVVEVKHRNGAMGSQQIRSFLGGRHPEDKGLYVCTGGFTRDARYEAERATIPLMLMDLSELVLALMDNYSKLDIETQRLVPLKKIYLPV